MTIKNYHSYFVLSLLFIFISCSKQQLSTEELVKNLPEGYSLLKVNNVAIEFKEEKLDGKKASAKLTNINGNNKNITEASSKALSCDVSLEPISNSASGLNLSSQNKDKFGEIKNKVVDPGVRYRLYVYETKTGDLVTSAAYIRGEEDTADPLMIVGDLQYTIVAYSINSDKEYPAELENAKNITTATITNAQVEFMFHKQDIYISQKSVSTINLKFKHQFAQINTIVKLDATTSGYTQIRGIGGASYIRPSYGKTKFKVSDESISADEKDLQLLGSNVNFPFIMFNDLSVKQIESLKPTVLNTPTNITEGEFIIETLTIGNVSRSVNVEDLNIKPGVKYNLILTFSVPETTIIGANPYFFFKDEVTPEEEPYSHTVTLDNPTFGAQLDIWYLDNSFNLKINGENLFSKEVNFEGYEEDEGKHDVFFSDKTYYNDEYYGKGNVTFIFWINEHAPRIKEPVVRLTIDEDGKVSLYGRKSMKESLRELELRKGIFIRPEAKLKPNSTNTLEFTSTRWTRTEFEGRLYGLRVAGSDPSK